MAKPKKQQHAPQVYELKDGSKIVYFGISNDPVRRGGQHSRSGTKDYTHMRVISEPLTRPSAERMETQRITRYQKQHGRTAPRFNMRKTR